KIIGFYYFYSIEILKRMALKKSDEKFVKNWEQSRRLGRIKYGIIHGSIFAVLVITFVKIMTYLTGESDVLFSWRAVPEYGIGISLGIIFFASFMWWLNERMYKTRIE